MVSERSSLHGARTITCLWMPLAVAVSSTPILAQSISSTTTPYHRRNSTLESSPAGLHESLVNGEPPTSRTIYTVVSLVCISLLTGLAGWRARQLERHHLRTISLTRVLVLALYCLAISFVVSAAVVESGLGLSSPSVCHAAIFICLTFYVGGKVAMYTFLVERAHALRAPYMRRSCDWIWLGGMLTIACGFGSIAICGFVWPIANLSQDDGRCRIGLPYKVTIPLLSFDVVINTLLTAIFIYLLRPLLRFGGLSNEVVPASRFTKGMRLILKSTGREGNFDVYPMNRNFLKSIETLLWKSFIGSLLVMLPTVGNLAALLPLRGQELGWLCLTICTLDVTWAVCVIHWLTTGSSELDERALALLATRPGSASNVSTGPPWWCQR